MKHTMSTGTSLEYRRQTPLLLSCHWPPSASSSGGSEPAALENSGPPLKRVDTPSEGRNFAEIPLRERKYDFFINHCQHTGQDQCANLCAILQAAGCKVWLDMQAQDITAQGMEEGVANSRNVLIFLSEGIMGRPFCNAEQRWAKLYGCNFVGVFEADTRHGPADFTVEKEIAPDDLKYILEEVEFEQYQRRSHLQKSMMKEILRRGNCQKKARGSKKAVGGSGPEFSELLSEAMGEKGYTCVHGGTNPHNNAAVVVAADTESPVDGTRQRPSEHNSVKECAAVLVVCSEDYGSTAAVQHDLQSAAENKIKMVPIQFSGEFPPPRVSQYLLGMDPIDARETVGLTGEHKLSSLHKLVDEVVKTLKKDLIMPDKPLLSAADDAHHGARSESNDNRMHLDAQPFAKNVSKKLEMDKMADMDVVDAVSTERSLQLYSMLLSEQQRNSDPRMRVKLQVGFEHMRVTMKWLAIFSVAMCYIGGPLAGTVGGMVVQQRMQEDRAALADAVNSSHAACSQESCNNGVDLSADTQTTEEIAAIAAEHAESWVLQFGQVFIILRLWLHMIFISQFGVSLLFLTIQYALR